MYNFSSFTDDKRTKLMSEVNKRKKSVWEKWEFSMHSYQFFCHSKLLWKINIHIKAGNYISDKTESFIKYSITILIAKIFKYPLSWQ